MRPRPWRGLPMRKRTRFGSSKPRQNWRTINIRKRRRYSKIGRQMECEIAEFLGQAEDDQGNRIFERVIRHRPWSPADLRGKDITVFLKEEDRVRTKSFGVTISIRSFHRSAAIHPRVPVFFTPVNYNREHLVGKILALFD